MKTSHLVLELAALTVSGAGGLLGALSWWLRGSAGAFFWRVLRAAQVLIVLHAVSDGVLIAGGHKLSGLHLTYSLVPIAVSFVAEQLRIASAEMILDARGLESAAEVGRLPRQEQTAVAEAIIRRELGVMALALLVCAVLLARALGTG